MQLTEMPISFALGKAAVGDEEQDKAPVTSQKSSIPQGSGRQQNGVEAEGWEFTSLMKDPEFGGCGGDIH